MKSIGFGGLALLIFAVLAISGCGGGPGADFGGGNVGGAPQLTATTRNALPGGQIIFSANQPVSWSVRELSGGTITPNGTYTAPPITGTFHIVATSQADPTKTAVSAVTVAIDATNGLVARALADADYIGYPRGATLVRWPIMSSRVVAYLVYRSNQVSPIAVTDGSQTYYRDSASALPQLNAVDEAIDYHIAIDTATGLLTAFQSTVNYETTSNNLNTLDLALGMDTLDVTARRVPLAVGQNVSYQVQVLYMEYQQPAISDPLGHPINYQLRLGNKSAVSNAVTLLPPPALQVPADPTTLIQGEFRCDPVPNATSYLLQVSTSPIFPADSTITVTANPNIGSILGTIDAMTLWQTFHGTGYVPIYWRMGARISGQAFPGSFSYPNCDAWVFSLTSNFSLPPVPPSGP